MGVEVLGCQSRGLSCYGPNCDRIFGRTVTVGISCHFRCVGRIVENPGVACHSQIRCRWPNGLSLDKAVAELSSHSSNLSCSRPNCDRSAIA